MKFLKNKVDIFEAFRADYDKLPETARRELEQDLKSAWLLIKASLDVLKTVENSASHAGKIAPRILKRLTLTKDGDKVLLAEIAPHFPFLAEVVGDLIK